jgi:hypothetical protein
MMDKELKYLYKAELSTQCWEFKNQISNLNKEMRQYQQEGKDTDRIKRKLRVVNIEYADFKESLGPEFSVHDIKKIISLTS